MSNLQKKDVVIVKYGPEKYLSPHYKLFMSHLNRDTIESNLSVPGIQGYQENTLIRSFEMIPHLICP